MKTTRNMNGYSVLGNSRIRSQYKTLQQRYRAQERDESKFIENVEREPFEINWIPGPEKKKQMLRTSAAERRGGDLGTEIRSPEYGRMYCTPYGVLYCTVVYCTVQYTTVQYTSSA
jgi:hypothetical protein